METLAPSSLPVLPIRNAVLFPSISMPLVVGRPRSIRALEASLEADSLILIVSQSVMTHGDPSPEELHRIGTLAKIESTTMTETGGRQLVVTGVVRFRISKFDQQRSDQDYLSAQGEIVADVFPRDPVRNEALFYNLKTLSREILELLPGTTEPLVQLIDKVDDAAYLSNVCAAYLNLDLEQKQKLLETTEVERRMEALLAYMKTEREVLSLQREIRDKMSERLNKAQREALLREQLRTIRTELGEEIEENTDELEEKLRKAGLPEEAGKQAREELRRLKSLPPTAAEYHVLRTYIELISALPWNKRSESRIDVTFARRVLDEDHYGLETVKKRILQFLAVARLKNDLHGPILCLVGPPGVGKTSLGHSVARALGRKFVRASLGGVRDEAEIRGHRRTYVGAMPGRIIQSLKRAGVKNPLMMLDEIDKLRADFHGDPSSAMLEVLDPEQNHSFTDHYIDMPFDLSEVFFIATANMIDTIPPPLRDRMEIIEVNGYTSFEKLHIARRHLLPKQLKEHGLKPEWVEIPDETLARVISHYTREAGVRELQRKIASLMRGAAEEIIQRQAESPGDSTHVRISEDRVAGFLGPERYFPEVAERALKPGVVTGVAWTPHGGDLLFVEASAVEGGKGTLTLTGQLGDVMKESAQIALSLARRTATTLLRREFDFTRFDLHIHVPAGAIPKDGPSAGVTIFSAICSLLLDRSVLQGVVMTGEVTLRGAVLPVGGIKEKVLAAHRAGIRTFILPARNRPDLHEVPKEIQHDLHFVFVETVEEVLMAALDHRAPEVKRERPQKPHPEAAA
jgi:ATP-dependent Lon protease